MVKQLAAPIVDMAARERGRALFSTDTVLAMLKTMTGIVRRGGGARVDGV